MCFNLGSCTINFVCHFINGLIERLRIQELFDKKRGSKKKSFFGHSSQILSTGFY